MIYHILVYVTIFLLISTVPWQSQFDHIGTRKLSRSTWRRSWCWKHDDYSRKRSSSSLPCFSFPYKIIAQEILKVWHSLACPLESLISVLFWWITSYLLLCLLLNYFLCWDIKDSGTRSSLEPPETTPKFSLPFQSACCTCYLLEETDMGTCVLTAQGFPGNSSSHNKSQKGSHSVSGF